MDSIEQHPAEPNPIPPHRASRPTRLTSGLVAGGVALGAVLAGLGIASAQTTTTTAENPPAASTEATPPADAPADGAKDGRRGHPHFVRAEIGVAADALGMTKADLATELKAGKSIAAVAGEKNVPVDTVINAMVDAAKTRLAQAVTDGKLTQAQADKISANLTERITNLVNRTPPADGEGRGREGHPGVRAEIGVAADALGMTKADLATELKAGKSIAAVAGEKNVPVDTVINAMVDAAKTRLAQAVTDGKLTQAQADKISTNLTERITNLVNRTPPADGEGPGDGPGRRGPRGQHGPDDDAPDGTNPAPAAQPASVVSA